MGSFSFRVVDTYTGLFENIVYDDTVVIGTEAQNYTGHYYDYGLVGVKELPNDIDWHAVDGYMIENPDADFYTAAAECNKLERHNKEEQRLRDLSIDTFYSKERNGKLGLKNIKVWFPRNEYRTVLNTDDPEQGWKKQRSVIKTEELF